MDITSALFYPDLGCTAFTVERITYTRTAEGTASRSQVFSALGCIHPSTPEMIRLLSYESPNFKRNPTDQLLLRLPQKNRATVPGPVCAPIVEPMGKICTFPCICGNFSSTSAATACASSRQSEQEIKTLPE